MKPKIITTEEELIDHVLSLPPLNPSTAELLDGMVPNKFWLIRVPDHVADEAADDK